MPTLLGVLGLLAALALLWTGLRKSTWRSPLSAVLSMLDVLALALAIIQLGWLGLALFIVANVLGFVGWGLAGAIYVQAELSGARAFNPVDPEQVDHVNMRLEKRSEF